jgi:heme-degrading monooxygenase HmoA
MKQIFIDKFLVPQNAKQEFIERMTINRNFIKTLNGFIEDAAYERTDEDGNLICVTTAVWENEDVLKKAKDAVQEEYKKQGFNMLEMLGRLNITIERALYTRMEN